MNRSWIEQAISADLGLHDLAYNHQITEKHCSLDSGFLDMNAKLRKSDTPALQADPLSVSDQLEIDTLVTLIMNRSRLFPAIDSYRNNEDKVTEVLLSFEIDNMKLVVTRFPEEKRASGSCLSLSPREMEIARMVARGYPNKTIAAELDISHWTVGTHIRRIFDKAGVASRAEMVAKLMENGVMSPVTLKTKT